MGKTLPRYMNMRQMADELGISKYAFRRLFDRHQLPHITQGRDNVIDVKAAFVILAKVPGIEFQLSDEGRKLMQATRTGKLLIQNEV